MCLKDLRFPTLSWCCILSSSNVLVTLATSSKALSSWMLGSACCSRIMLCLFASFCFTIIYRRKWTRGNDNFRWRQPWIIQTLQSMNTFILSFGWILRSPGHSLSQQGMKLACHPCTDEVNSDVFCHIPHVHRSLLSAWGSAPNPAAPSCFHTHEWPSWTLKR